MKNLLFALLIFSPLFAHSAQVSECGWLNNIDYIAHPFEQSFRDYANGNVRVVQVDTYGEPACCSSHLLVFVQPSSQDFSEKICYAVNQGDGLGYQNVVLDGIVSAYSPEQGLKLTVPVTYYVDGVDSKKGELNIRINQKQGSVEVE